MPGKMKLNGKLMDVTTLDKYVENPSVYIPGYVAIEDEDYVLPVLPSNSPEGKVGIEVGPVISRVHLPNKEDEQYKKSNMVDFNKATSMQELINMQEVVIDMEKDVLTNPDNTSIYPIMEKDTPAMKLLKEAVNSKHINLDNYEHRFGSNYNNDKRIFNKNTVSLAMMERMASALDMKLTLTLQDAKEDVPNPIGKPISIDITGGSYECE